MNLSWQAAAIAALATTEITMSKKFIAALVMAMVTATAHSASTAQLEKSRQQAEITKLVVAENYGAVVQRANQALTTEARFADGMWRLSFLYGDFSSALQKSVASDKEWDKVLGRIEKEARTAPMAWLLYEQALSARAWSARGPNPAVGVSPDGMRAFRKYLQQARTILDTHKERLEVDPAWFSMRLSLATELGEDEAYAKRIFDEGRRKYPRYHATYFNWMRYLSPNWHGSKRKMLDALDDIRKMEAQAPKEGLYARLVWFAGDTGIRLIHDERIDTQALQDSSQALSMHYPDQWNVQKLLGMACERSNRNYAMMLSTVVTEPPLSDLWKNNLQFYELCKDWAMANISEFTIRVRDGDQYKEILIK